MNYLHETNRASGSGGLKLFLSRVPAALLIIIILLIAVISSYTIFASPSSRILFPSSLRLIFSAQYLMGPVSSDLGAGFAAFNGLKEESARESGITIAESGLVSCPVSSAANRKISRMIQFFNFGNTVSSSVTFYLSKYYVRIRINIQNKFVLLILYLSIQPVMLKE